MTLVRTPIGAGQRQEAGFMLPKALVSANGRPRGVTGKRLGSPGSAPLRSADHSQAHRLLTHAGKYPAAPWRWLFWAWAIVFGCDRVWRRESECVSYSPDRLAVRSYEAACAHPLHCARIWAQSLMREVRPCAMTWPSPPLPPRTQSLTSHPSTKPDSWR